MNAPPFRRNEMTLAGLSCPSLSLAWEDISHADNDVSFDASMRSNPGELFASQVAGTQNVPRETVRVVQRVAYRSLSNGERACPTRPSRPITRAQATERALHVAADVGQPWGRRAGETARGSWLLTAGEGEIQQTLPIVDSPIYQQDTGRRPRRRGGATAK